LIKSNHE